MDVWFKRGFDFEVKSRSGKNCVFAACKFGHVPILKKLEEFGIKLKAISPKGREVLCYALVRGNIDAFIYLLNYYQANGHLDSIKLI